MVLCSCKSLDGWIEPAYDPWLDSINEQTIIPTSPKLGSPMYQCPHLTGDTATTTREGNHTIFFYCPNTILNLELSMYSVYSEYSLLEL